MLIVMDRQTKASKQQQKSSALVCAKDVVMRPKDWLWRGHLLAVERAFACAEASKDDHASAASYVRGGPSRGLPAGVDMGRSMVAEGGPQLLARNEP
jgi:hypothetical protein